MRKLPHKNCEILEKLECKAAGAVIIVRNETRVWEGRTNSDQTVFHD